MKNILNRISKIISSAIFIILILIIVLILAYVIRIKYLYSQGRLGDVKLNFYTILTQSMVPTIYAGDVVVTYKDKDNHYNNGDIITFTSDINGGINITHRIKETYIVNNIYSYKTKGDNNNTEDNEIVKGNRVLGKVILKIPKVGFLQQFLIKKVNFLFLIVIPCLGIILYDILKALRIGIKPKKEDFEYPDPIYPQDQINNNPEEPALEEINLDSFDNFKIKDNKITKSEIFSDKEENNNSNEIFSDINNENDNTKAEEVNNYEQNKMDADSLNKKENDKHQESKEIQNDDIEFL